MWRLLCGGEVADVLSRPGLQCRFCGLRGGQRSLRIRARSALLRLQNQLPRLSYGQKHIYSQYTLSGVGDDSERTACIEVNIAGTLNVSKNIWAAWSRFTRGFNGASVNSTGC